MEHHGKNPSRAKQRGDEIRAEQRSGNPMPADFFATTVRDAFKLKKVMLKRGLRRARAKCPECEGMLHAVLAGKRNHIHFNCDGPCNRSLME